MAFFSFTSDCRTRSYPEIYDGGIYPKFESYDDQLEFPSGHLPDKLGIPRGYFLHDEVEPVDLLSLPLLSNLGIVVSSKLLGVLKEFNLPPYRQVKFSIDSKNGRLEYHWIVVKSKVIPWIHVEQSLFFTGDRHWSKRKLELNTQEELDARINGIPKLGQVGYDMIVLQKDFPWDIFKNQGFSFDISKWFCSGALKKRVEELDITGIKLIESKRIQKLVLAE